MVCIVHARKNIDVIFLFDAWISSMRNLHIREIEWILSCISMSATRDSVYHMYGICI